MAAALAMAAHGSSDLAAHSLDRLTRAVGELLQHAVAAGEIRSDIDPEGPAPYPCGARREGVDRVGDDVGVNMLGEVEAHRAAARARPLRIVIGNGRNSREVRKAHRHRSGAVVQVWRARARRLVTKA